MSDLYTIVYGSLGAINMMKPYFVSIKYKNPETWRSLVYLKTETQHDWGGRVAREGSVWISRTPKMPLQGFKQGSKRLA